MDCQQCNVSLKAEVRKGTRFCSASCRAASWRGRENAEHVGKILAGLNQERAAAQLAPLVRDAALDALATQRATLRGRFTRRYILDASGEKPAAPRSPRLLEPDLTHCGVALVEQAVGQHFLVIMLAEATR